MNVLFLPTRPNEFLCSTARATPFSIPHYALQHEHTSSGMFAMLIAKEAVAFFHLHLRTTIKDDRSLELLKFRSASLITFLNPHFSCHARIVFYFLTVKAKSNNQFSKLCKEVIPALQLVTLF